MDKTAINRTLRRLRSAFPLQARLHNEREEVQAVYVHILRTWIEGHAPPKTLFPSDRVQRLVELDAIVASPTGLGCYPFSTRDTGIRVTYKGHDTYAMCAIDALAIPALVQDLGVIDARCTGCQQALALRINGRAGCLVSMGPESLFVHYPRSGTTPRDGCGCSTTLCQDIGFVCAACVEQKVPNVLAVEEALVVAQQFFSFQTRLLATYSSDRLTQETVQ